MDFDVQNYIYNLREIKALRLRSGCRGITWGLSRNSKNPLRGSHTILITEEEVVVIAKGKARKSPIYFFEYKKVTKNSIGEKLKPWIRGLPPIVDINAIRNIPEIDTAYREAGGKGRPYGVDPDSPLFGSHIIFIEPDEILIIR